MCGLRLERYVKANLSEEEAEELYRLGKGAVVWALLEMAARWKAAVKGDEEPVTPSTPSGQMPVYKKPNSSSRGRKKPGREKGHPGVRREEPERIDAIPLQ